MGEDATEPSARRADSDTPSLDEARLEAERRLTWMRLAVTVTGSATFPLVADGLPVIRWLAYALLGAGWIQSVAALCSERWLRRTITRPARFVAATEAILTLLWVYSTGGVESPWFVALYATIIWVSLQRPMRDTILAAVLCGSGYVLMAAVQGKLAGHLAEVAVRVQYVAVVAAGSSIIARERLSRLKSRIRLLGLTQDVGQIGTWEWSVRHRVLTWSDEVYRALGLPRTSTPTLEIFLAAVHPEDRTRVDDLIRRALVDGQPYRFDHRIVTAQGAIRILHCRAQVVLGPDGLPRELVGSIQDITERTQLEVELAHARKLASLGTLASGVAHEINNPLAYVASNLDLIERRLGDEGQDRGAESVKSLLDAVAAARHGSARMRDIVQGLKTFSRSDEDDRDAVDLARVADLAVELASHEIEPRATLVRDYAPTPRVLANESRLSQVFVSLLVNAAQAIPRGAAGHNRIGIRIHPSSDGRACIELSDTGSGIAPEHLGRIFDPFFTTKSTGEGTGLGLAICHGIVADLHGEILVTQTGSEGTTFRISLPALPAMAPRESHEAATPTLPVGPTTPTSSPAAPGLEEPRGVVSKARRRILLIDDEARYAESLRLLLAYEHDVMLAKSAERALEILAQGAQFDVIFCDLMMPGKSGMELYDDFATAAREQRHRVVFLTGGATNERARAFLARPEIRYVEKPVELERLEAIIEEVAMLPADAR